MTEFQVIEYWVEHVLPYVIKQHEAYDGIRDIPARHQSFCDMVDMLQKDGMIDEETAHNAMLPDEYDRYGKLESWEWQIANGTAY